MVCSTCNGAFSKQHNSRTCPLNTNPNLCPQTHAPKPATKVSKPLEGLAGCKNIWKEPKVVQPKKVAKPLEGLAGCKNIWKEPKVVKAKKVSKPLEGLAGCKNIWKEPKVVKANRSEFRVSKALLKAIRSSGHLSGVGILSL
jgi:hypothetical protein